MIVLVRHGPTEWSVVGRHTGKTDLPLTDEGRQTAALLRERLARYDLAAVLVSPLRRARETAELAGLADRAQVEPGLHEWDYGAYEGLRTKEIREQRPGWYLWRDGVLEGETVDQVGERADHVIARALEAGGDVALFGHGHILRALGARWIGLPAAYGGHLSLGTAAVCELGTEREHHTIKLWNDTSHIRAVGRRRRCGGALRRGARSPAPR